MICAYEFVWGDLKSQVPVAKLALAWAGPVNGLTYFVVVAYLRQSTFYTKCTVIFSFKKNILIASGVQNQTRAPGGILGPF